MDEGGEALLKEARLKEARSSFRGYDEFRQSAKTRQKRSDALGESLLCEDGVAGRYIIQ